MNKSLTDGNEIKFNKVDKTFPESTKNKLITILTPPPYKLTTDIEILFFPNHFKKNITKFLKIYFLINTLFYNSLN